MNKIRTAAAAVCLAARLLLPIKGFSEEEVILNETLPIEMVSDFRDRTEEKVQLKVSVDEDNDTLKVGIYTQDYKRKVWTGEKKDLPLYNRHTQINNTFSRFFVLRPSRAKISDLEQKAFLVPNYQWKSDLLPYEKREITQFLIEATDKGVSSIISEIPFLGKAFDKFIKDAQSKEEDYYKDTLEKIEEDYTSTKVLPYIPRQIIGQTETAREYIIHFDVGSLQGEIPMYVLLKIALGDSSIANHNAFPNRYGELEKIVKFSLNKDNVQRDELEKYFLHEEELKFADLVMEGTKPKREITTVRNMDNIIKRKEYESERVARFGKAEYILPADKDAGAKLLVWEVVQFESEEARKDCMERTRSELKYPLFTEGPVISYIYKPTIKEMTSSKSGFSDRQCEIYADIILDYMKRTGMSVLLDENPEKSERLLIQIQNYK